MTNRNILTNDADVEFALSELIKIEPRFAKALQLVGIPELRTRDHGFRALFKIIVGQKLSVAAANAIWFRLDSSGVTNSEKLLSCNDEVLRLLGLSKTKIAYSKGLALKNLNYDQMTEYSDKDISEKLQSIKGIGEWTVQIYLMFSLGRADIFAAGDLALREAIRNIFQMETRPSSANVISIAEKWKPFRSVAALLLWKYYGFLKNNKDLI